MGEGDLTRPWEEHAPDRQRDRRRELALRRALRTEREIVRIRWLGVAFGIAQTLTYYIPHPPGMLALSLGLIGLLAVGNVGIMLAVRRLESLTGARTLSVVALGLDVAVVMGLVFTYTFDPDTAIFAIVYVLPLEGAVRFQLRGALATMAVASLLYALREAYGTSVYGNEFLVVSITFRMGIGFLIAAVAGTTASSLVGEREEAERAKEELERKAAELVATNLELKAANEVKDEFVAMTNHELRTPLTTILGYTGTLRKRWEDVSDERRREFVCRIEQQGRRLLSLVEGLLTISSVQAGALDIRLEPVEVRQVVAESLAECGLTAADVDVRCPPGMRARADAGRLRQILTNYLSNAVKYGESPVVVEAREVGPWVEIAVTDAGPGVPESFVPRLFERFSQASHGDSRTAAGTGLGLAIVAQLADAQGGRAWYESNEPTGARFCVRLIGASEARPPAVDDGRQSTPARGA